MDVGHNPFYTHPFQAMDHYAVYKASLKDAFGDNWITLSYMTAP
jgi:hypothetical protein